MRSVMSSMFEADEIAGHVPASGLSGDLVSLSSKIGFETGVARAALASA